MAWIMFHQYAHSDSRRTDRLAAFAVFATLVALVGCNRDPGPPRVVVSGSVTHNGAPVTKGRIRFTPVCASEVPTSGAVIVDGRYRIDAHGGVPVGTHAIQIEASEAATTPPERPSPNAESASTVRRRLTKPRNENTTLEITIPPGSPEIGRDFDMVD